MSYCAFTKGGKDVGKAVGMQDGGAGSTAASWRSVEEMQSSAEGSAEGRMEWDCPAGVELEKD